MIPTPLERHKKPDVCSFNMNQNPPYTLVQQKPYCCVPACICMILNRRKIPHATQDEIGYELGLTVPKEKANFFTKVRTGKKPTAGYGTQVEKYSINEFFRENNIKLKETYFPVDGISDVKKFIKSNIDKNNDIIVCFNNEKMRGEGNGHVCLIQGINDNVSLVDPEEPKMKKVELDKLIDAIKYHGQDKRAGFWVISEE